MILKLLINSLCIFGLAYLLPGVTVQDFWTALWTAIVLGLLNIFLKPLLLFLSLPANILTLGLFTFFVNAFIMLIVAYLVPGLEIATFWWAFLFSFIMTLINYLFKE